MPTIMTVVGARPQFIKAGPVSLAFAAQAGVREALVHTGQHYDANMSQVFFDELGIGAPAYNLGVGSGSHGHTTGRMLMGLEDVMLEISPSCVLVYGDTNSTLAGALVASKAHIPVVHVEAGLRSFDRRMPEELNRIATDHLSDLLLCPTSAAMTNLAREGLAARSRLIGDVMFDAVVTYADRAEGRSRVLQDLDLRRGTYFLATVHRPENTDDPGRLALVVRAMNRVAEELAPVVFPVHPRTRAALARERDARAEFPEFAEAVRLIPPVSYFDMLVLQRHARAVLTDSGGMQKEAYFHGVPCVTLRESTEWVETVAAGWNTLVGVDPDTVVAAASAAGTGTPVSEYGDGNASALVLREVLALLD